MKEYNILEFYIGFLLNGIYSDKCNESYYINYLGNNLGKKRFIQIHSNDNYGSPILNYDQTMLMDKFNIDDLLKILIAMMIEYKIILVFEDYSEINELIFSLTSLLYPMKWSFPIVSYITPNLIDTFEAPFGILIGAHVKYLDAINEKLRHKLITEETIIYNLKSKSFVYLPDKLPNLPTRLNNDIRSNLYIFLSERLSLSSDIDNTDIEMLKVFDLNIAKQIEPPVYLNLRIYQIFFNFFIELIKNLDVCIFYNKLRTINLNKEKIQLSEVFDFYKFIHDREYFNDKNYISFVEQFSKSLMFMEFVEKYIRGYANVNRYKIIKDYLTILNNSKDNHKLVLKRLNRDYIKKKITDYYNVIFFKLVQIRLI
jgi:hypothetical protein